MASESSKHVETKTIIEQADERDGKQSNLHWNKRKAIAKRLLKLMDKRFGFTLLSFLFVRIVVYYSICILRIRALEHKFLCTLLAPVYK